MSVSVAARHAVSRWSFLQYAVFVVAAMHVVWSIAGWIAQPSFAIGEHAPTTPVICMDYNGWHAVAGLALFGPALILAFRKSWAAWWCIAGALGGGFAAGIWAWFSHRVAWIFTFPHNHMDAVVHIVTGVILLALVGVQAGWTAACARCCRIPRCATADTDPTPPADAITRRRGSPMCRAALGPGRCATMTPLTPRPLRSDARRNRALLLDAAREMFADHGIDVAMADIARHAGVSNGTLYNRFPTRGDLVEAVFVDRLESLAALAERAAADPDPWNGFVAYVTGMCELQAGDRGFNEVAARGMTAAAAQPLRDAAVASLADLFARAELPGAPRRH